MAVKKLDSFSNLILLCKAHHTPIDRKSNEKKHPEALLRQWKSDREGDFAVQLSGLDGLDGKKLQDLMADAVTETKREITAAIDGPARINRNTDDILRTLVAESFGRLSASYPKCKVALIVRCRAVVTGPFFTAGEVRARHRCSSASSVGYI